MFNHSFSNPYGPRAWADDANSSAAIEAAFPGYRVISVAFDVCGYIYRMQVQQMEIKF